MDRLLEWITEKLMNRAIRKGEVLQITGTGGKDDIYLIRYYVMKSRFFNFFIHQFLRSDRDDMHDHPWHFCTYLVRGSYTEKRWNPKTSKVDTVRRHSGGNSLIFVRKHATFYQLMDTYRFDLEEPQNRFVFRKSTDQHQVLTDHHYMFTERQFAPLTLCFTGPTIREWGFVREEDSPFLNERKVGRKIRTWVPWRKYLGLPEDAPGRG